MALTATGRSRPPADRVDHRTRSVVTAACLAAVLGRLAYVGPPLGPDEGGYLLVARHWEAGGEFLYGDHHVDRPPLLMLLFRLAAVWEWDGAIRLLTVPFVVLTVLAVAGAAHQLAGPRAVRWSAVTAAALLCTPATGADQADGGLFAPAFVAVGMALAMRAWRSDEHRTQALCAGGAGVAAVAAALVKQSFLEGLVLVATLIVAETVGARRLTAKIRTIGGAFLAGGVVPFLLLAAWAVLSDTSAVRLWRDLVVFRGEAVAVIWDGHVGHPLQRAALLAVLALVSGMLPLAWCWMARRARTGHGTPEEWAISACLAYGLVAMVAGASFWRDYLLQLVVPLALAVGMAVAAGGPAAERTRRWAGTAVASAVVATTGFAVVFATTPTPWHQEVTGRWLAGSSRPGDDAVVLYGNPSILETADLDTPYPHLWSLSMRTLDPDQDRLVATLSGRRAPDWVVLMGWPNAWDIDADHELRSALWSRYRLVATVCDHRMLLRRDLTRELAAEPGCR